VRDDDIEANLAAARRAGWHAILVESDHAAAMSALSAALT